MDRHDRRVLLRDQVGGITRTGNGWSRRRPRRSVQTYAVPQVVVSPGLVEVLSSRLLLPTRGPGGVLPENANERIIAVSRDRDKCLDTWGPSPEGS